MDPRQFLIDQLDSSEHILLTAAADLTEKEFLFELPGQRETANWIFGHLAINEDWFLSQLTGSARQHSQPFYDRYFLDTSSISPPPDPPDRGTVLDMFRATRSRVKAAVREADPATWSDPPPPDLPAIFRSRGAAWGILGTHPYWHVGHIVTIRAMLGRPVFTF